MRGLMLSGLQQQGALKSARGDYWWLDEKTGRGLGKLAAYQNIDNGPNGSCGPRPDVALMLKEGPLIVPSRCRKPGARIIALVKAIGGPDRVHALLTGVGVVKGLRAAVTVLAMALTLQAGERPGEWKTYEVTAYCACRKCCGQWSGGPAACGKMPRVGVTVAGPRALPFGTVLEIEGVGRRVVQDRLARRFDHRLDLFMGSDPGAHGRALAWGKRHVQVRIVGKEVTP